MDGELFVELQALLAVMNEDDERAEELLNDMLPGELDALRSHVFTLGRLVDRVLHEKRSAQKYGGSDSGSEEISSNWPN